MIKIRVIPNRFFFLRQNALLGIPNFLCNQTLTRVSQEHETDNNNHEPSVMEFHMFRQLAER